MSSILDELQESRVDVQKIIKNVYPTYNYKVQFWMDTESSRFKPEEVSRLLPEFLISNRFITDCSPEYRIFETITTKVYISRECNIIIPKWIREEAIKQNPDIIDIDSYCNTEFNNELRNSCMYTIARTIFSLIAFLHDTYECSFWNEVDIFHTPTKDKLKAKKYTYLWGRDFKID